MIHLGRIVEIAETEELFAYPLHPYTKRLFGSIPSLDEDVERLKPIPGLMPDPANLPVGCKFCTRCSQADKQCEAAEPEYLEVEPGHFVRCNRIGGAGNE